MSSCLGCFLSCMIHTTDNCGNKLLFYCLKVSLCLNSFNTHCLNQKQEKQTGDTILLPVKPNKGFGTALCADRTSTWYLFHLKHVFVIRIYTICSASEWVFWITELGLTMYVVCFCILHMLKC